MENFRHATPMTVRFGDLDAMGHLNNARYFTFTEQARIEYVEQVCGWGGDWQTLGMILAKTAMDFKKPVLYGDKVIVYTRCSRLGGKSFDLEYVIVRGDDEDIVATSSSVMVAFDYVTQQTIPVPEHWRERIIAYEPVAPA